MKGRVMAASNGAATTLAPVSNDGAGVIGFQEPFSVTVTIRGVVPLLFHRWSNESIAEKAKAAKGSAAKKSDDVDSYVWRDGDGHICLPGVYLLGALVDPRNGAAKYRQDPRSPRKSALDLFRAGVSTLVDLAPVRSVTKPDVPTAVWDYLDERRAVVQRQGITRSRPAFLAGWEATIDLVVNSPEYIDQTMLLDVLGIAGRLVGVGDFRPTYGRFQVVSFDRLSVI
jgi:hypothetical protein